jgi:hypothetical protein
MVLLLLLLAIYRVLNPRNVNLDMKFPISRVFTLRWLDEVRDVECFSVSMAQTYKFVIARVKNNDSSVNFDSLCPCLTRNGPISIIPYATVLQFTCCTKLCAFKSW